MVDSLFQPIHLGAIEAPNRIVMAPLTRGRAGADGVPTPIMATYYSQRASAGLIISEATGISREGAGWPSAPGLWTDAQTEAWKPVIEAVHQAGGRIVAQLWHMGRIVHPYYLGGEPPVSASATRAPGHAHTPEGTKDFETARPLRLDEMPRLIDDYGLAAENAKKAGFDGVQLHAANGYLIDQFLRNGTNLRDDSYGGSVENRARLLGEVTERLVSIWGAGHVSVRLSPNGDSQGTDDSDPAAIFAEAARVLQALNIGFLEAESRLVVDVESCPIAEPALNEQLRDLRAHPPSKGGLKVVLRQMPSDWKVPPDSFFQNNFHLLPQLVATVGESLRSSGVRFLIDLYCGVGFFGISLGDRVERFIGVEVDQMAIRAARQNAVRHQRGNGDFLVGRAEDLLPELLRCYPREVVAVILDPPRTGCPAGSLALLREARPAQIIYISCQPATLARDLNVLCADGVFELRRATPLDMFPQTQHVECVADLRLAEKSAGERR